MENPKTVKLFKVDNAKDYLPRMRIIPENEGLAEAIKENSDEIYAIGAGDETVGVAYVEDGEEAFIYVYIFDEYRSKGYGSLAVREAEGMLKEAKSIMTGFKNSEDSARRFSEKCGFKKKFASAVMRYSGEKFDAEDIPVRHYRDEDFLEAFTLVEEAFHRMRLSTGCFPDSKTDEPTEEDRQLMLKGADDRYVYVVGGEVIGYGIIEGIELDIVAIKIAQQGKGYGRKFVKHLVNIMIGNGIKEPILWCVVGNNKARKLYESLGFVEVGRAEYAVKKLNKENKD